MDLLDGQPEFTKSIWDYLDILAATTRGSRTAARSRRSIARPSTRSRRPMASTGLHRGDLGRRIQLRHPDRRVGDPPTATLACIGRRQDYFREEFLSALEILARGDVTADHLGSWAGAGPDPVHADSFKRYAVDFDGDGRRDVVEVDVGMIAADGEQPEEGRLGGRPDLGLRGRRGCKASTICSPTARACSLCANGSGPASVAPRQDVRPPDDRAYLLPAGAQGPGFLMLAEFPRDHEIQPGRSSCASHRLSRRPAARRRAVRAALAAPRAVLSRTERYELQQHLAQRGYDVGEPGRRVGGKTRAAIRQYQSSIGQVPDGLRRGPCWSGCAANNPVCAGHSAIVTMADLQVDIFVGLFSRWWRAAR